jgi:hypothetical protein
MFTNHDRLFKLERRAVLLLELAAQGIRGVSPAGGRATLRSGYNVVAGDGAALRRLLLALLQPARGDAEDLARITGAAKGAPAKAGLTLVGADRVTYRVMRDFSAGCTLHRFDPGKRTFAPVSQDLEEIAAFLRKTAGAPAASRFGALQALSAADQPSRGPGGLAGSASLPAAAPRAPLSPEQVKKRLGELRAELERARASEKLQGRVDALQGQVRDGEQALEEGRRIREGLEKAEAARAELEPAARAAAGLGDAPARIAAYEKAAGRREEATARAEAERESLAAAEARGAPPPLWRLPELWVGVGVGVAALAVGIAGVAASSGLRWVALLDVPGFGWAAWVAWRWVGALEGWERVARRRRIVDDWERKVVDGFERDSAAVRGALQAAGLPGLAELKEALGRLEDAEAVVAEWRRRLEDWEASPEVAGARARRGQAERELQEAEARMADQAGGFVRDARSIEQEIRRLETEGAGDRKAPAAPPSPPPRPAGDPIRGALEAAAAELSQSPAGAGRAVQSRASQVLSGLAFQRLQGIAVDDRGNVQVAMGGRPSPASTLPPPDRDLVWLALKLALLEQGLAAGGFAVVEDAFGGLSDGAKRFAARFLKQIAKGKQIVHGTTDAAFREAADSTA